MTVAAHRPETNVASRSTSALMLGMALFTASCGNQDQRAGAIVRDSAGVRLVEYRNPYVTDSASLRLGEKPILDVAGDDRAKLVFVNLVDALPLSDGSLAVANAGTNEIFVLSSSGTLRSTLGRSGSGPGEFRRLGWIDSWGNDSIVAADLALRRIQVFDTNGQHARTVSTLGTAMGPGPSASTGMAPQPLGLFADGSFLAASYDPPSIRTPGSSRPRIILMKYAADASSAKTLGSWPGDELYLLAGDAGIEVLTPVFGRITRPIASGNGFWIGDSDRWELRWYSTDGVLRTIVRRPSVPTKVTQALREEMIAIKLHSIAPGPHREQLVEEQTKIEQHTSIPTFSELQAGSDGRLWVRAFALPNDTIVTWQAFAENGSLSASAAIPAHMKVLSFGEATVIVSVKDDLDRESVQHFELIANGAAPRRNR